MRHHDDERPRTRKIYPLSHDVKHFSDSQEESVQLPMKSIPAGIFKFGTIVVLRHKPFPKQAQPLPQHIETSAKGSQGRSGLSSTPVLP